MSKKIKAEEYSKWDKNLYKENKTISPLEAWKRLHETDNDDSYWYGKQFDEDEKLIETALNEKVNIENRIDEIFENHNIKSFTELNERLCDYNELKFDDDIKRWKLKALEIIKEKQIYAGMLIHDIEEHHMSYEEYLKQYDCYQQILIPITKEEFDLLKEVLL